MDLCDEQAPVVGNPPYCWHLDHDLVTWPPHNRTHICQIPQNMLILTKNTRVNGNYTQERIKNLQNFIVKLMNLYTLFITNNIAYLQKFNCTVLHEHELSDDEAVNKSHNHIRAKLLCFSLLIQEPDLPVSARSSVVFQPSHYFAKLIQAYQCPNFSLYS